VIIRAWSSGVEPWKTVARGLPPSRFALARSAPARLAAASAEAVRPRVGGAWRPRPTARWRGDSPWRTA